MKLLAQGQTENECKGQALNPGLSDYRAHVISTTPQCLTKIPSSTNGSGSPSDIC